MLLPTALTHRLHSASTRRLWLALLLLTMLAVCWLAFDPDPPAAIDTGWDKRNHLLAFLLLAVLAELSFWPRPWRRLGNALSLLAFGAFIELVQSRIPGRSGEWPDLLADGLGIVLGLAAVALLLGPQRVRSCGRRRPEIRPRS